MTPKREKQLFSDLEYAMMSITDAKLKAYVALLTTLSKPSDRREVKQAIRQRIEQINHVCDCKFCDKK